MSTQPPTQSFLREGGARALLRLINVRKREKYTFYTLIEKVCEVASLAGFFGQYVAHVF